MKDLMNVLLRGDEQQANILLNRLRASIRSCSDMTMYNTGLMAALL